MTEDTMGERMKAARLGAGLSMKEAAEQSLEVEGRAVSHQQIAKYESGVNTPGADAAVALSRVYGVSLSWMLMGEGEMEPVP